MCVQLYRLLVFVSYCVRSDWNELYVAAPLPGMGETTDTVVRLWSVERVGQWLRDNGFGHYYKKFGSDHRIDGSCLLLLTEDDLRLPPLQLTCLGDIKRLHALIKSLRASAKASEGICDGNEELNGQSETDCCPLKSASAAELLASSADWCHGEGWQADGAGDRHGRRPAANGSYRDDVIDPEIGKALLSFLYAVVVFFITSFVMTVVHERVPDTKQYPPLPDIFLDNFPYIPWAFALSELIIAVLAILWAAIVIFHKHRFIVIRRYFSLLGSVFLLRCVTMLITSLSVPGIHLDCAPQQYHTLRDKLERAYVIWSGMGMSLQGVRTCGDYMFSGHTVVATMLNMFITEYTPRHWYYLHTATWIMSLFGIFFILAAHEHYSIDVFVAFYITMRLFQYYHTLADNQPLLMHDRMRTRVWFPLFSFFESNCRRAVPSHFEFPMHWLFKSLRQKVKL